MARRKAARSRRAVTTPVIVAVIGAAAVAGGGISQAVGQITSAVINNEKSTPPQLSVSCVQLYQEYSDELVRNPRVRLLLERGEDGQVRDPQARYCGFSEDSFPATYAILPGK